MRITNGAKERLDEECPTSSDPGVYLAAEAADGDAAALVAGAVTLAAAKRRRFKIRVCMLPMIRMHDENGAVDREHRRNIANRQTGRENDTRDVVPSDRFDFRDRRPHGIAAKGTRIENPGGPVQAEMPSDQEQRGAGCGNQKTGFTEGDEN